MTATETLRSRLAQRRRVASGGPPRIGLIGCGAIAERFHLPALVRSRAIRNGLVLVDPDEDRLRALASRYRVRRYERDFREALDELDGVIVAVPPRLHHSIALTCVRSGVSVLCEKPLAVSSSEAQELVDVSRDAGVWVAVNNTRRLFPSARRVKQAIASGELGTVRSLTFRCGEVFDWPSATDSCFGLKSGGKGVVLDVGAHVLDLVCWWLGGAPTVTGYLDDSLGGSEAVAHIEFEHEACRGLVRLSWLSKLENAYRIHGDKRSIEGKVFGFRSFRWVERSGRARMERIDAGPSTFSAVANHLIDNFLDVVRGRAAPLVSGEDVLPSIRMIEACYARRARFDMPWHETWGRGRGIRD